MPRREQLDDAGQRTYDSLADPKHRKNTNGLDEADAIVIELGREIFGVRKVASATFVRSLRQFGRRSLVDPVALMGNYAGTAALLTAFDMQLDPNQPPLLPP